MVEHKPEVMAIADHVGDIGPGAGAQGGMVCFAGTVDGMRASDRLTGRQVPLILATVNSSRLIACHAVDPVFSGMNRRPSTPEGGQSNE